MGNYARKLKRNVIRKEMTEHPKLKKLKHDVNETAFSKFFHEVIEYERNNKKEEVK